MLPLFALLFKSPAIHAYTDNILASKEEVWEALLIAVDDKGIASRSFDSGKMKTKWTEDKVIRENPYLNKFLKATYKRRSRYQIQVQEVGVETTLQIKGTYQFKPSRADFRVVWRTLKPTFEDRLTEQEIFFKVLKAMGEKKLKQDPSA